MTHNTMIERLRNEFAELVNRIEETKAMNIFRKTGFMYYAQKECFILPDEEKIYNFLSTDINEYMQKFEVMVTDNFKAKNSNKSKIFLRLYLLSVYLSERFSIVLFINSSSAS